MWTSIALDALDITGVRIGGVSQLSDDNEDSRLPSTEKMNEE